ncbi:Uncharacterised protein [Capnocytophaga ochracea]|uniref:Uncharacterized protein n=1 Tax=Capnocytophaga ochracea TaxID=1018 RepID=A0A7Z8YDV1_CAPOC|nr:Uncharacterised protein [Capnocytophaga ochracea]
MGTLNRLQQTQYDYDTVKIRIIETEEKGQQEEFC